jgi:putative flavoprotein involved in K+ transport
MPTEQVETLIIGGGQAGIAMSAQLGKRGRPHLVLERHRIAERWRSERWDELRFQTPNGWVRLCDYPFPHTNPDAFASAGDIADFITAFAHSVAAPVRCGVAATTMRRRDGGAGFHVRTSDGSIDATNVVVATGPFQRQVVPPLLPKGADVFQVHASAYRNPDQLPDGAVLIIGSGASGSQIADELMRAGRRVCLCISRHSRLPHRYRGRIYRWWFKLLGTLETPVEKRGPDHLPFAVTGAYGGYTIDFRRFAARGLTLLGRAEVVRNGVMSFAPDLASNLAHGDAAYMSFLDAADANANAAGLDLPEEPGARVAEPDASCVVKPIRRLDLRDAGIATVIWATGYAVDFGWIDIPVFDESGTPIHRRGVTDVPGLYFLGLEWLSRRESALMTGVGYDAAYLADHIAATGQL